MTGGNMESRGDLNCDVLIAGCGVSGLFTALTLPSDLRVTMLSKDKLEVCDSMLAQGGISVLRDAEDYGSFYDDTMRAGHYKNRPESVDIMISESRKIIDRLVEIGVAFDRTPEGELSYTTEAGHSRPRICHCEDLTGREVTTKLLQAVQRLSNVSIIEHATLVDIVEEDKVCAGAVVRGGDGGTAVVRAKRTVLATGGVGGLYGRSTNYPILTGDACRIAARHGVALQNMDCVQFHPTGLYTARSGRVFLISESARGEGAVLLDARGRRFTDELQPRDLLTAAIKRQMKLEGSPYVRLSFEGLESDRVRGRFPNIYRRCLEEGYDITREAIPVAPAQHYLMGGIRVDNDSQTSMEGLFAVGETSCNGVHGSNRLASNSLLESMVFASRAARKVAARLEV